MKNKAKTNPISAAIRSYEPKIYLSRVIWVLRKDPSSSTNALGINGYGNQAKLAC